MRVMFAAGLAALLGFILSLSLAYAAVPPDPAALAAIGPVDCATFPSPVVAYDTTKGQIVADVPTFLNDLLLDGFSVGTISGSIPACVDVLIVRSVSGTLSLASPYTPIEAAAIKAWVDAGHALMLFSDWGTYRTSTAAIFTAFGYGVGGPNALIDTTDYDPIGGNDWVIYQTDNFTPHAILEGVGSIELLRSAWFSQTTGSIVRSDANSNPPSVPVVAVISSGSGCVVLSSDSDWVNTNLPLSRAGYLKQDNALLARQAISWLQGCGQTPTARAGGPYVVNEGSSVMLDGSSSSDPGGQALSFAWDLDNDYQFDDAFNVNPIFSASLRDDGVYTVSLRVSDGIYTDTGSTIVTVLNVSPTVFLSASALNVEVGTPITFTGSFTDPGVLDTHTQRWDFGDGTPPILGALIRSHAFNVAGSFQVTLTVTDDDGGSGSAMVGVGVTSTALLANAGGPYAVNEGSSVTLNGSGSIGATTYAWDLDNDGQFDDAAVPNPLFSAAQRDDGSYPVALRVTNNTLTRTQASTVTVSNVAPQVSLLASATSVITGQPLTFIGSFVDPGVLDTHGAQWNFGDGSIDAAGLLTRTHAFTATGRYTVTLIVTDDDGGVGQAVLAITVAAPVIPKPVLLPLVMRNFCVPVTLYADVVLVLDVSQSMAQPTNPGGPTKLQAAQAASASFLNQLTLPGDQASIVSFGNSANVQHPLSVDRPALIAAVQALQAGGLTRMDLGLAVARNELLSPRHLPANTRAIIFLTDGHPSGTTDAETLNQAALTKAAGITIFTIGLGSDVNATLLQQIASSPDRYYFSPTTDQLAEIYTRIAEVVHCR